ncbi:MAG: hypothetical protein AAGJ37_11110 [Pseudomonadota bacterium]
MTRDIVLALTDKFEKNPCSVLGQQLLDAIMLVNFHSPGSFRRQTIQDLQQAIQLLKKAEA